MPTLSIEFEVYCSCGNGLCGNSTEGRNGHSEYITVEPCEKCLINEYEKGIDDGYQHYQQNFERKDKWCY